MSARRRELLIPFVLIGIVVAAALHAIVHASDLRTGSSAHPGSPDPGADAFGPSATADQYVDELRDALVEQHPSLEGVSRQQFGERSLVALRRVAAEEPALLARAAIDGEALARAFEWDALCRSWLGSGGGDADARIDARLDLLATALIEAVGDPFTVRIRGDHFLNAGRLLESQFPSEVGVLLGHEGGATIVRAVLRDSDAGAKGLRAGDRVVAIDGEPVADLPARTLAERVAHPCRMSVTREGLDAPVELALFALDPTQFGVRSCRLDADVGYVTFSMFSGTAFGNVLLDTRRLLREGARAIVLDLRGNPGGLIAEALAIANLFLPSGVIVTHIVERGATPDLPADFESTSPAFGPEVPLVVLVDRSSASASELLTGALKDHRRALIVGERTFGKGIGQSLRALPLARGATAASQGLPRLDLLWLTSLRFLPPNRGEIHGVGIEPDLFAPPPPESRGRWVARARLLDDAPSVERLAAVELTLDEVSLLRRAGPLPASIAVAIADLPRADEGDDTREALKDVARLLLRRRHPLLAACPELDPALGKSVAAAHLALRRAARH